MAYQLKKHKFALLVPLLVLLFIIACGTAAPPEPAGVEPQPEPQAEPTAASPAADTQAPQAAPTPTAVPQQTPESPQAIEPAGTLNVGLKS